MITRLFGIAVISATALSACGVPSGYRTMNQLTYGKPVHKVAKVQATVSTPYNYATVPVPQYRLASRPTYPVQQTVGQTVRPVIANPAQAPSVANPIILGSDSRPQAQQGQVVYQAPRPQVRTVVSSSVATPYVVSAPAARPVVTLQQPAPLN